MSDTVWVGYHSDGYEGCSEPLRAFESKELAELWKVGASDNYASGAEIIELQVIRSVHQSPNSLPLTPEASTPAANEAPPPSVAAGTNSEAQP